MKKCLNDNKDKIAIIESLKSEKSKKYTDLELFILWSVFSLKIGAPPFCNCMNLTANEYIYCVSKIFGEKSGEYTSKTINREQWDKKSSKRYALEIIDTYDRRGVNFLNNIWLKGRSDLEKEYLDDSGRLNEKGKKIFEEIAGKGG
jgi:hypothetical protein